MKNKTKKENLQKQETEELMKNVIDTLITLINLNLENFDEETIIGIQTICDSKRYPAPTILNGLNNIVRTHLIENE